MLDGIAQQVLQQLRQLPAVGEDPGQRIADDQRLALADQLADVRFGVEDLLNPLVLSKWFRRLRIVWHDLSFRKK